MRSYPLLAPRGWGALAGGFGTLLVGFYAVNLLLLVVGTTLTVFVLAELLRFSLTTQGFGPEGFVYTRYQNSAEVTVGDVGSMGVRLEYRGRWPFFAEIFDSHPDSLEILEGSARLVTWWSPGAEKRLVYAFRALRRGALQLGPTVVVAHDPFGFAFRVCTVENPWTVEAMLEVPLVKTGPSAFEQNRPIEGAVNLPIRGMGTEFRSLRDHQPSDDIRTVAWKRSTMGRLYVREFERETPQEVVLLVDTGRRMGAGELGSTALDRAIETAALVVRYALLRMDRVGLLLYSDGPALFVRAGRGSDLAAAIRRGLTEAAPGPGTFDAAGAFSFLAAELTGPTHLLVFAAPGVWRERDSEAYRQLTKPGHRVYFFFPDLPGMYAELGDDTSRRVAALVDGPENARLGHVVRAVEGLSAPVFVYNREGPTEAVAELPVRSRAFWRIP
ncbi:MAG: DUF58 domain-containing protein [Thermoplasmata archaeon]|nr:DUF58 domain-containing protein [Thermoplasmata archaeon]